jgi:hypothetical protein
MIFDASLQLSNAQAITVSAPSTNTLDLGATGTPMFTSVAIVRDIGKGEQIPLLMQVVQAFAAAGAATLQVAISTDTDPAFPSPVQQWLSPVMQLADLKPGKKLNIDYIPRGVNERYMRIDYIVASGPFTAGAMTAGVTMGNQTND